MTPARTGTSAVLAVLGAAVLLLLLVTWAASIGPDRVLSGGSIEPVQPVPSTATTTAVGEAPDPVAEERAAERGEAPLWAQVLAAVLQVLAAAAVALLAALAVRRAWAAWQRARVRRRRLALPEHVEFEALGATARVGAVIEDDAAAQRSALLEDGEPRNAIVACWHRFEVQATRAGVPHEPWQTTGEFVLEVLERVGADQGAVARLAGLYREARFSDHPVTEEHRAAAVAALDELHRSLAGLVAR